MRNSSRQLRLTLGCAALALFGLAGCGGVPPETRFQHWSSAVQAQNFPEIWKCLAPQARGTVLQILVLDADLLSKSNPAAKEELNQVFARYDLNPDEASFAQKRLQVVRAADYAADLHAVFSRFQQELNQLEGSRYQKLLAIWNAAAVAAIGPRTTQGIRATVSLKGTIPQTSPDSTIDAVFEKVNGQWLLAEIEESGGAAAVDSVALDDREARPGMGAGAVEIAAIPAVKAAPGGMPGMPAGAGPNSEFHDPARAEGPMRGGPMIKGAGGPPAAFPKSDDGPNRAHPGAIPVPKAEISGGVPAQPPKTLAPGAAEDDEDIPPAAREKPHRRNRDGDRFADEGPEHADPARPGTAKPGYDLGAKRRRDEDDQPGPGRANDPARNPGAMKPGIGAGLPRGADEDEPAGANLPGRGGAGAGGQNRGKKGSLEYAVMTFLDKVAAGDYTDMEEVVSVRAKGQLAEIRDDTVSEEEKEALKEKFAAAAPQPETAKNTGATLNLKVKGGLGHTIQLAVGKEDGVFKIRSMKITDPEETAKP